ncbi:MAG: N-acetylglucosamine-6-phosphate deacetylase [Gammaproteobacteria bacterium]|nr:N-acetylglucosamine-6-phosphate deacetylase [Gammaproteobacteria bacterium]
MVAIVGPKIYAPEGVLHHATLVTEQKRIHTITQDNISTDETYTFPEHYHLLPGWIDLHVHGIVGCDVMDADLDSLEKISQALARFGTTSFLATTMTASIDQIDRVLGVIKNHQQIQNKISGAKMLGVHLEGPFISPEKMGAQNLQHAMLPDISLLKRWQTLSDHAIRLVTLAPELAGAKEFIEYLVTEKMIPSIGHTHATFDETMAAIEAGCAHMTHLFNAMRGIHQREPGVVTAGLLAKNISTEIIVDGVHLHPAIVELIYQTKSLEKMILITDAMRATCLGDGVYDLGGQSVTVKNQQALLSDGTLAGSTLTMSQAVRNMMRMTHCGLIEIAHLASANPAKVLKIFSEKGSLTVGKDADCIVLDEDLNVVFTMCEGRVVYSLL